MNREITLSPWYASPITWIGGWALELLDYLGALVLLTVRAGKSIWRPEGAVAPFVPALLNQLDWLFLAGIPLVALVNFGMGSFLSMQAYFGATFVVATGPVVGVGLIRNVAPMLTGLLLVGMWSARTTAELKGHVHAGIDGEPIEEPDRDLARGRRHPAATDKGRLTLVRVVAGVIAGPVLALWGGVVGTVVGCLVAHRMFNLQPVDYLSGFWEMLWLRDIVGLAIKGMAFGGATALLACHEGLIPPIDSKGVPRAMLRSAILGMSLVLAMNSAWFLVVYRSGLWFGPTVLPSPASN